MSWIAVAGVAVTAVGAGISASGAAKSAAAIGAANEANAQREQQLYDQQQKAINQLSNQKQNKLSNLGNIFDRMQSTGAFGNTDTLKNLRQAQSDYSALAAGDFSGFENQLKQSLSDSLIATAGAGAPIGTFAGLAAQDQMNLRGQGIQTTMGISEYLSKEAYQLLGNEFGIMDQKFEVGYKLNRDKVSNLNNYALGQASTEGVGLTAYGNAAQQTGSSIISAYNNYQNQKTIRTSNDKQLEIARLAYANKGQVPPQTYNPSTGLPTYMNNLGGSFNVGGGSGRSWRDGPTGGAANGDAFPSPDNLNNIIPENVNNGLDPYGNGDLSNTGGGPVTLATPMGGTTFGSGTPNWSSNQFYMNPAVTGYTGFGTSPLSQVGANIISH